MQIYSSNNKPFQAAKVLQILIGKKKKKGSEGLQHLLVFLKRYKITVLINLN